jgi:hypothetical protein
LLVGVLLAAGAVVFVLRPLFRSDVGRDDPVAAAEDEGADPDDDLSPRAVALRALKEIEFDRATGKLSETDYALLKLQYTSEALTALRAEDAGSAMRDAGTEAPAAGSPPASRLPPPASRISHPVCPAHGARSETGAQFCSECGRRLCTAPGYCARCGTALEHDAHYCHSCGARVAA